MLENNQNINELGDDILAESPEEVQAELLQEQMTLDSNSPLSSINAEKRNTITLTAMLIAGLVFVYVLKIYNGPQHVTGATQEAIRTQVDNALKEFAVPDNINLHPNSNTPAMEMLDKVYAQTLERQISLGNLRDNPFIIELENVYAGRGKRNKDSTSVVTTKAYKGLENLKLESIVLAGEASFVVISGRILNLNHKINGWTIQKITPHQVVLAKGPDKFTMIMQE